jgi:hypothetical protein
MTRLLDLLAILAMLALVVLSAGDVDTVQDDG